MKEETKLKKWSLGRWKEEAWKYCSLYNRQKDCDWRGYGSCCTCNKTLHWEDGDAGHFMSGRGNAILFYDRGIHLQCKQCNYNQGEQYLYSKFIERRYGKLEVKKQEKMRHQTRKYTKQDYVNLVKKYKKKLSKN